MTEDPGDLEQWTWAEVPGSGMRVRYPVVTASGASVDVDQLRIHARSTGTSEIYFEVSKESRVTAKQQYERERAALERSPSPPAVSELTPAIVAGRSALRFSAKWPDRERVFTLIEDGGVLYRTVHDPGSPINEQIVATLEWD